LSEIAVTMQNKKSAPPLTDGTDKKYLPSAARRSW